jgi:hypothetical protein
LQGPVGAPPAAIFVPEPAVPVAIAPVRRRSRWVAVALAWALLLSIVLFALWRRTGEQTHFRVTAATRLPGTEYQPAISADGMSIAFLWAEDPSADATVWVVSAGDASPRPLARGEGQHSSPVWSPDGTTVYFLRLRAAAAGARDRSPPQAVLLPATWTRGSRPTERGSLFFG